MTMPAGRRIGPLVAFLLTAIGAFVAFSATRSHLPPVVVSVTIPGDGPIDVAYDTGYGFNPDQTVSFGTVAECNAGPVTRSRTLAVHDLTRLRITGRTGVGDGEVLVTVPDRGSVRVAFPGGCPDVVVPVDVAGLRVRYDPVRTTVQAVLAVTLGGLVALGIGRRRSAGPGRRDRTVVLWFLVYGTILGVWVVGLWPGILVSDSISPVRGAVFAETDVWFSAAYSLVLIGLAQFGPVYAVLSVVQTAVLAGLAARVTAFTRRCGAPRWIIAFTVLAVASASPVLGSHAVLAQRGVFAALVCVAAVLLLYRGLIGRTGGGCGPLSTAGWAAVWSLTLFAALLKRENLLGAGVAFAAVFLFRPIPRRRIVLAGVAFTAAYVSATGPIERWVVGRDTREDRA